MRRRHLRGANILFLSRPFSAGQDDRRIFLLGPGGVGKLVAHAILSLPDPPPLTLLVRNRASVREFLRENKIHLRRDSTITSVSGFDVASVHNFDAQQRIGNLIITVKAHETVEALKNFVPWLDADSTVVLIQNGMGVIAECERLFEPGRCPAFGIGVNSHGTVSRDLTTVWHTSPSTMALGLLPRQGLNPATYVHDKGRYLIRTLTRTPALAAISLPPLELFQTQLEKLSTNCIINPITTLMDSPNGKLTENFALSRSMFLLLSEISLVIQSLPELKEIDNVKLRFSTERLYNLAISTAHVTSTNTSSMLQDLRRGRLMEIEYINGYIVKRGEELGIKPTLNYLLMQLVLGKSYLVKTELDSYTPVA